ncbi:calcium ATPase transmembrane domain M-containing protein [Powellomyces hirtus]|nr:calcium ATPase transmembrane domain M-containing protein [Powellomyces hirtus]
MSDFKAANTGPIVTIVESPFSNPRVAQLSSSSSNFGSGSENDLRLRYRTLSVELDGRKKDVPLRNLDVHLWKPDDIFTRFSTHPEIGLEAAAVARKVATGQKNVISPPSTKYFKQIMQYVFGGFNFLMWIALIVTVLSYQPLGSMNGGTPPPLNLGVAVLLLFVILISATFYAYVDWSSSRIMQSIKSLITEDATVIRDGRLMTIPSTDVVVGDVVQLSLGQRVPADVRLVKVSSDLAFDRALLTGESDPVSATVEPTDQNVLESHNIALSCTFVVQGSAKGVVFAIGDDTVMGRIIQLSSQQKQNMTTIQRELWRFTVTISTFAASLFSISLIFWATYLRIDHSGFATISVAIINSIGCLTAFVPQGLPVCVALSLTIIAKRMAARKVLVKNLATIETLGCMSVLCSDKTGTLTEGHMHVQSCGFLDETFSAGKASVVSFPAMRNLQACARLCNGAVFDESTNHEPAAKRFVKGDATDSAVLRFAADLPDDGAITEGHRKLFEIPFNSKNKWMMTLQQDIETNKTSILVKGAPDILFRSCSSVLRADGTVIPLTNTELNELFATQEKWSSEGHRVIALCSKEISPATVTGFQRETAHSFAKEQMRGLTLVGLLGIRDPPRPDVLSAVDTIRNAFVRVFMVTGDFRLTAVAIARSVGIITNEQVDTIEELRNNAEARHRYANAAAPAIKPQEDDEIRSLVLVGEEVVGLNKEEWNMAVGFYTEIVFARTTPEQKLQIVEEIKKRGDNTVAVTGDGVNDAPALKAADIGIAMGAGSDVAKEAAAMVLLNNDFPSIVVAIENGRLVFDNLKKVLLYLMPAGSFVEFVAVVSTVFFGMPTPLSSFLQVTFCVFNDIPMSIPIMYERAESDLMKRRPRNARTDRLTDWRFFLQVYLFIGLMMFPCAMGMFFFYMGEQRIAFYDIMLAYERWGTSLPKVSYSSDDLRNFVNVGNCIYYVTMIFMQFGSLLAVRNRRVSIFQSNPFYGPRANWRIFIAMLVSITVGIFVIYFPPFQNVFGTAPIPTKLWFIPWAFGAGILLMDEIRKAIVRAFPQSIIAKIAW